MGQCVSSPAVSGETEQQMRARWEAAPDGLGACAPREPPGGASPQPKPKVYTTTANVGLQRPSRQPAHPPAASARLHLDPIDENNSLRVPASGAPAAAAPAPGGASPVRHHPHPHAVPAPRTGTTAAAPGAPGDAHPRPSAAPTSYTKGQAIGQGAFGTVYLGMDNDTGRLLAIKEAPLAAGAGPQGAARLAELVRSVEEEVALLQDLDHPNVVAYLGTERFPQAINILMEYVPGGSIASLLAKFGSFNESVVAVYTKQILAGLDYLHTHGIIHRDIKGANILVDNTGLVKLADFGASKKLVSLATIDARCKSIKGTPYWMAPEVITAGSTAGGAPGREGLDAEGYGSQADIWSVACTVIEMATGKPPWSQYSQISAMMAIVQSKGPPTIPEHLSPECKDFLYLCFNRNWRRRPSAAKLLQHPFLADVPLAQLAAPIAAAVPAAVAPGMSPLGNHLSNSKDAAASGARRALDMDAAAAVEAPLRRHSAGLARGTGSPIKQPVVMASAPVFSPGMFVHSSSGGGVAAPLPPLPAERPEAVERTLVAPDPATLGELRLSGSGSLAATLRVDGPAPTEPAEPSVPLTVALSGGLAPTIVSPDSETQLVGATVVLGGSVSAGARASLASTVQQQQHTAALSGSVGVSSQSHSSRRSFKSGDSAAAATSGVSGSSHRSEFNPMEEPAWLAAAGGRPGSAVTAVARSEGKAASVEPLLASGQGSQQRRSAASSASSGGCRTAATASEGPVVYTVEADGHDGGLPWDLPAGGTALARGGSGSLASGWTRAPSVPHSAENSSGSSGAGGADQAAIIGALREQAQQDVRASMAVFQAIAAAQKASSGSSGSGGSSWGASAASPLPPPAPADDATEVTSPARHRVSLQPSRIPRAPDSPAKVQLEALRRSQAAVAAAGTPSKAAPTLYASTPSKALTRAGSGSGTIPALVPPLPTAPTPSKLRALQAAGVGAGAGASPTKRLPHSASLAAGSYEQQLKARQQLQFGGAVGGVGGGYAARAAAAAGTPAKSAVNPLRTPRRERPAAGGVGPGRTPGRRASAAL